MPKPLRNHLFLAGIAASALSVAAYAQLGDGSGLSSVVSVVTTPITTIVGGVTGILPTVTPTPTPDPSETALSPDVGLFDFTDVKAAFDSPTDNPIPSMVLIIGDRSGNLTVYKKGGFEPTDVTGIASASKWLVGTLAERMIEDNKISLTTKASDRLSFWTTDPNDPRSGVTLGQAISLQSGFNAQPLEAGCAEVPIGLTLQGCARIIYDLYPTFAVVPTIDGGSLGSLPAPTGVNHQINTVPGTEFSYGPHHLQLAAAMLEQSGGGDNFNALFQRYVAGPLGMTHTSYNQVEKVAYNGGIALGPLGVTVTDPLLQVTNPWAAGGGVSTAYDYAKLMRGLLNPNFIRNLDAFTAPRTTGLARGFVPGSTGGADGTGFWQYAMGSWAECTERKLTPAAPDPQTCTTTINSSPGAYGWLGWIDRETGYYAVIARAVTFKNDGDHLPVFGDASSIVLEKKLQPLIRAAIRKGRGLN